MSNTRTDRGFRFPLQKYSAEKALYTNFRYLQDYLNYIRKFDRYATQVIIAVEGSPHEHRAHYLTDGTNDEVQIQAAHDDLPATGGEIVLLEGNYNIANTITFSKPIRMTGKGAKLTSVGLKGFALTSTSGVYVFDGFEVVDSSAGSGYKFINANVGTFTHLVNNYMHDTDGMVFFAGNAVGPGARFTAVNNIFETINIRQVGGGITGTGIFGVRENPGNAITGIITGNVFRNITATDPGLGTDLSPAIATSGTDTVGLLVVGNTLTDLSTTSSATLNAVVIAHPPAIAAHNIVDEVMESGDHSDILDHGLLPGLTDDDHTQYVLRNILTTQGDIFTRGASAIGRLALGTSGQFLKAGASDPAWATLVEADISDLDHDDADAIHDNVAGEITALTLVTAAAGDHVIIEDVSDSNNKKRVNVNDFFGSGNLNNLSDVIIAAPTDDQHLVYDSVGGVWKNKTVTEGTYTPTLTSTGTNPTLGSGSVQNGWYIQIGKLVMGWFNIAFGSSGASAGTGTYIISLPVSITADFQSTTSIGTVTLVDASSPGASQPVSLEADGNMRYPSAAVTATAPWTWTNSDRLEGHFQYYVD